MTLATIHTASTSSLSSSTAYLAHSRKSCVGFFFFFFSNTVGSEDKWGNIGPIIWNLGFLSKISLPVVQIYHSYQVADNNFWFHIWSLVNAEPDTKQVSTWLLYQIDIPSGSKNQYGKLKRAWLCSHVSFILFLVLLCTSCVAWDKFYHVSTSVSSSVKYEQ